MYGLESNNSQIDHRSSTLILRPPNSQNDDLHFRGVPNTIDRISKVSSKWTNYNHNCLGPMKYLLVS